MLDSQEGQELGLAIGRLRVQGRALSHGLRAGVGKDLAAGGLKKSHYVCQSSLLNGLQQNQFSLHISDGPGTQHTAQACYAILLAQPETLQFEALKEGTLPGRPTDCLPRDPLVPAQQQRPRTQHLHLQLRSLQQTLHMIVMLPSTHLGSSHQSAYRYQCSACMAVRKGTEKSPAQTCCAAKQTGKLHARGCTTRLLQRRA